MSQTVNTLVADEVKRRYWPEWNEDNKDAISAYNDRIAEHGLTLAKYRVWSQSLGDDHSGAIAARAPRLHH